MTGGAITGWRVTQNFVDVVNPARSSPLAQAGVTGAAPEGSQVLNLASGVGQSAIAQTVPVTPGSTNILTFNYGTAKTLVGVGKSKLEVLVTGGPVQTYELEITGSRLLWFQQSYVFVAATNASSVTVTFRSDDDPFDRITMIDSVQLNGFLLGSALAPVLARAVVVVVAAVDLEARWWNGRCSAKSAG